MQSETLAQEFARLVKEYHEGDEHTKPEAWNLLADFAVDNADAISDALSDKQAVEVKGGALVAQTRQVVGPSPYTNLMVRILAYLEGSAANATSGGERNSELRDAVRRELEASK